MAWRAGSEPARRAEGDGKRATVPPGDRLRNATRACAVYEGEKGGDSE
ncbi:MAG: hypothetical protein KKE79_08825 [Actinobacteria bacterium]|nr:hypothetical protein [Actinomycetota bacterium]MBU4490718.1 hypothetical protein [Actinomycetota bacterium]